MTPACLQILAGVVVGIVAAWIGGEGLWSALGSRNWRQRLNGYGIVLCAWAGALTLLGWIWFGSWWAIWWRLLGGPPHG